MSTALQATSAAVVLGGGAAATSYGATVLLGGGSEATDEEQHNNLTEEQKWILNEPKNGIVTFQENENFTGEYSDKFITKLAVHNRPLLVKANQASNKLWWDWAFKNKYLKATEEQKDSIFTNVVEDKETPGSQNTLSKACDNAYKAEKSKFDTATDHLLSNISLFCTTGPNKLDLTEPFAKTYKDETSFTNGYTNGILKQGQNKTKLVKSTESDNQKWWDWAFKNKFKEEQKSSYNSIFQSVTKGYETSATGSNGSRPSLNHACDEAYKKAKAEYTGSGKGNLLDTISLLCTTSKKKVQLEALTSL